MATTNWWENLPDLQALGVDPLTYMFSGQYRQTLTAEDILNSPWGAAVQNTNMPRTPNLNGESSTYNYLDPRLYDTQFGMNSGFFPAGGSPEDQVFNYNYTASFLPTGDNTGWYFQPERTAFSGSNIGDFLNDSPASYTGNYIAQYIPDRNEWHRVRQEQSDKGEWDWLAVPLAAVGGAYLANAGYSTGAGAFAADYGIPLTAGEAAAAGAASGAGISGAGVVANPIDMSTVTGTELPALPSGGTAAGGVGGAGSISGGGAVVNPVDLSTVTGTELPALPSGGVSGAGGISSGGASFIDPTTGLSYGADGLGGGQIVSNSGGSGLLDFLGFGGTGGGGGINIPGIGNVSPNVLGLITGAGIGAATHTDLPDTITSTKDPWSPAQPYLTDIMAQSQNLYNSAQWTPGMQSTTDNYLNTLGGYGDTRNNVVSGLNDLANWTVNVPTISAGSATGGVANVQGAMSSYGAANPTQALSELLAGTVDNPWLSSQFQGVVNTANQNFADKQRALRTDLTSSILPQLGLNARGSGSFGSSRQGIAEGNALGTYADSLSQYLRDLTASAYTSGANLYGTAYENAQGRKASTAQALSQQATSVANANAQNATTASVANANNSTSASIAAAQQAVAAAALEAQARKDALAGFNSLINADAAVYGNQMDALNAQYNFKNNALGNYANTIIPISGQGGSATQPNPNTSSLADSIIGSAIIGSRIGGLF